MRALRLGFSRLARNEYFPFVILFLVMLVLHAFIPMSLMDDRHYKRMTEISRLFPYLVDIYGEWSSRLIILTAVRGMLGTFPPFVWRVLNPAVFAMLGLIISRLVTRKASARVNWFITFLLFTFPFIDMRSAGWVTTSLNYLWVAAFGLYAILLAKKTLAGDPVHPIEYALAIPALLYGANQEQMAVILVIVFMVMTVIMIYQKKYYWYLPTGLLLSIASLLFSLFSPGNAARKLVEMDEFIDFDVLSVVDKLEIGFSSTMERLVFRPNLLFALFCLVLAMVVIKRFPTTFHRVYALLLFFGVFYFGFLIRLGENFFPFLQGIQYQITDRGFITLENFTHVSSFFPFFIASGLMVMVFSLLLTFFRQRRGFIAGGILLLGFLSRVMLGFSPSIWASSSRTMMFLYIAIILCAAMLFDDEIQDNLHYQSSELTVSGIVALISLLNLVTIILQV